MPLVLMSLSEQLAQLELLRFKKRYAEGAQLAAELVSHYKELGNLTPMLYAKAHQAWFDYQLEGPASADRAVQAMKHIRKELSSQPAITQTQITWGLLLHSEALIRYDQGLYGQAIGLLKEALQLVPTQHLERARLYDSLAVYYEHIGSFERAIKLLKRSIELKRSLNAHHELAVSCQILGRLSLIIEELTQAEHYLDEARELSRQLGDPVREASLVNDLIKITILKNDLPKAQRLIDDAEHSTFQRKLWAEYGTTLLYKTFLLFLNQQMQQAELLLNEKILPIFKQYPNKKGHGVAVRLQAALLQAHGKHAEAIETMSEAIAIFQTQRRPDELAKTYFELAKLYAQLRQQSLAKQSLMEALKIAETNSLSFLVAPIEDELYRIDSQAWEHIVDKRVRHQPLFSRDHNLIEALLHETTTDVKLDKQGRPTANDAPGTGSPKGLLALLRVGQALAAERDLQSLLRTVKDETERALDAERCTVFVLDAGTQELWSQVASGLQAYDEIRFPAYKGLAGYVVKTGEILNIPDAYTDPRFNAEVDKRTGYRTRNLLCVPMRNRRGDILGVFQVLNKRKDQFTQSDEDLLVAIAGTAGVSIENALMAREQKRAFDSFIITLSSTIDARDPITAGHSERVADYSLLIADEMGMTHDERETLKYSSLLHDIGKIGIREEVLVKDGRLTVEQYKHIQEHAKFTYDILQNIHFESHLQDVPEVAASHHEKMDGTGYFRHLKGNEIPKLGRVIAITDVFDAITSRRHYRNRMPFERVLKLLRQDANSHFDADLIEHFFKAPVYRVAQVLVKERLFTPIAQAQGYVQYLDRSVRLNEFEAILASQRRTKAEQELVELFEMIYNVTPQKPADTQ
jgi:HD-GYP domain-containing protein (c-di-GMP phosphodiesterase class II)/tetratricopeptide (TPR) repeat protein